MPDPQLHMRWPAGKRPAAQALAAPAGYLLRPGEAADIPAFRELMARVELGTWSDDELAKVQATVVPGGWWVAIQEASGELVATGMAQDNPAPGVYPDGHEVGWIAAHPEHAGHGLGRLVTAAATARLVDLDASTIYLRTDDFRLPALKTYLRLGFVPDPYAPGMAQRWAAVLAQLGWPPAITPGATYLARVGLDAGGAASPPASPLRFPEGGAWRVEIPSVEGPAALHAVLEAAETLRVPIHRVSQGSGIMMLTDPEIAEMVALATDRQIELCLFVGPRAAWDTGAQQRTVGGTIGGRVRGRDGLAACVAEAVRATGLGVSSLLVADEGVLWTLHQLRTQGVLPASLQLKHSVQAAPANPASFRLLGQLGADTVNVPSDLSLTQLAELRAASPTAIDFYLEAPDSIGGFVRLYEIAELIRVAAPVYLKFGLRNAPEIYPSGQHLAPAVLTSAAERVRRARLGLDILHRYAPESTTAMAMSPIGARDQLTPDGRWM